MNNLASAILWRGISELDGSAPVVLIATGLDGSSYNEKTGPMVQTWILRAGVSPLAAIHSGEDAAICGNCPHRGDIVDGRAVGRSCYVNIGQAPRSIWQAFAAGSYLDLSSDPASGAAALAGKRVRMGSYGDPCAVPLRIWEGLLARVERRTGYTHQWAGYPEFAPYVMASCDTLTDYARATLLGFRTFRVVGDVDAIIDDEEIICPSNLGVTCYDCGACGGTSARARVNIAIPVHGSTDKVEAFLSRFGAG